MASNGINSLSGSTRQRLPRSRNGCLTCRRRKVRCNEQKPRCSHCERLDLQCTWRAARQASSALSNQTEEGSQEHQRHEHLSSPGASERDLDFNSLLWQGALQFDSIDFDWSTGEGPRARHDEGELANSESHGGQSNTVVVPGISETSPQSISIISINQSQGLDLAQLSPASWTSGNTAIDAERNSLVEHFLASVVPPILAIVETGPRWTSTKLLLISLAAASGMVQDAIAAFSALQLSDDKQDIQTTYNFYYDRSREQVLSYIESGSETVGEIAGGLSAALVVIFFLSYSALLSDRAEDAHLLLQCGAQLLGKMTNDRSKSTVIRLISWIRLVDSRASSAGGSGLFLKATDRQIDDPHEGPELGAARTVLSSTPDDLEEILFDMLYTPGLIFYQRVQSIMARVSAVDKWHRSRGTVKDETEVMAIAARISKDLLAAEVQRPALMDAAVAGCLTDKHVMAGLASAIVRSYRTYWANYHAGHIHLHRVAYIHLEASAEVRRARTVIKNMAHLLERSHDQLPANFIWPLLMACCEEDDPNERAWMIAAIRGMQSGATNAKPIAHVIEEVHRRQDATQRRADIRQVSLDLFNRSFAVF